MSFHKLPKDDTQHQNHLDGAVTILTGNLAEEATRAGLDNHFQRWIEDLKDTNNPDLHQIVVDLQALKAHFGGGTIDKALVSQLLSRMGENTTKAASKAENPNTAQRITSLGQALSTAARQVSAGGQSSPEQDLQQNSAQNS